MIQKKRKRKKETRNKNGLNNRLIKDITIRDIRTLFEQEQEQKDYYKPKSNF